MRGRNTEWGPLKKRVFRQASFTLDGLSTCILPADIVKIGQFGLNGALLKGNLNFTTLVLEKCYRFVKFFFEHILHLLRSGLEFDLIW